MRFLTFLFVGSMFLMSVLLTRSSSDDDFEKSKVAFRRSEKKLMTRQSRRKERGRKKSERISSSDNCQIADDDRSLGCGWTFVTLRLTMLTFSSYVM